MADPKPWLLMDVDGALSPYAATPATLATGFTTYEMPSEGDTYPVHLNPAHGEALQALRDVYDLAWATTWGDDANTSISPVLGLPTDLPVIGWPGGWKHCRDTYRRSTFRGCWKTPHIATWCAGRPFAWFDDEVNRYDRANLENDSTVGEFYLHRTNPRTGMSDADFDVLRDFGLRLVDRHRD